MGRPAKEEVDIALLVTRPGAAIGPNVACVLKAEVLALREELIEAQRRCAQCGLGIELRRETEAVEALLEAVSNLPDPERFEEHKLYTSADDDIMDVRKAADAVRASRKPPL